MHMDITEAGKNSKIAVGGNRNTVTAQKSGDKRVDIRI